MTRWLRAFAALLCVHGALPAGPARAAEPEALVAQAVAAYGEAMDTEDRDARLAAFHRAEQLFTQVAQTGVENADLYTNLGNASLQAERLGPAVLAYRRALRLDPDQPRALQNLQHARSLLPGWVPTPHGAGLLDTFFFWHRTLPLATRKGAAALCFALAALLVAASLRLGQGALRNAALVPALAWAALLASVWLDPAEGRRDEAVIVAEETVARSADSPLAPAAFPDPLPGGAEVTILEERPPWARVRLANGRDAWVMGSSVARVSAG